MMTMCFDEARLQAFVDGELAGDAAQKVSLHLASCEHCAETVRAIESEMQMFAAAFECESPVVVPSEILRARIEAKIAKAMPFVRANNLAVSDETMRERKLMARWRDTLAGFFAGFQLAPQFVAVCAICFVGIVAFAVWQISRQESSQIARKDSKTNAPVIKDNDAGNIGTSTPANVSTLPKTAKDTKSVRTVDYSTSQGSSQSRVHFINAGATRKRLDKSESHERKNESEFLPGEQGYVEAISSLKRAIETHGKDSLSPQVRVEYERNLTVIDRAILETRQAVRRNPKNADAKEFMLAVYQSKIDLLSNVAEQTQIATASAR